MKLSHFIVLGGLIVAINGRQEGNITLSTDLLAGFPGGTQPCYTTPSNGQDGGFCIQQSCCSGGMVISNLCPNYGNTVKCCYSENSCATGCADGSSCSTAASEVACEILALQEERKIYLKPEHVSATGNNPYDGASALSNIRDMCYGHRAKRSNYCTAAPGGCVCLQLKMLQALRDYAVSFNILYGQAIEVNALAGSCHSATSYHYTGNTFDVSCTSPRNHCTALTDFCRSRSPVELCYPGGPCSGHETWVHCAL